MKNQMEWINRQIWSGSLLLLVGLLIGVFGLLLPRLTDELPFNPRLITGLGILLVGLGVANLVKFVPARHNPQTALRMVSEVRDERLQNIRARAGNRAFWVSITLVYTGLMWISWAENGSLPPVSIDIIWYYLAGTVILPFTVYIASVIYDEKHS